MLSIELAKHALDAIGAARGIGENFRLPNPHDGPTFFCQLLGDFHIPSGISSEFCDPPILPLAPDSRSQRWLALGNQRTGMPEIRVHKYRDSMTRKHHVWLPHKPSVVQAVSITSPPKLSAKQ